MLRSCLALALLCVCLIVPALAQQPSLPATIRAVETAPATSTPALPVERSIPDRTYLLTDPPAAPKRTAVQPAPAAVVADILRIRAAQGDSNPENEAEFRDALRQVANEEAAKRAAAVPATSPTLPPTLNPYITPQPTSVHQPLVQSLRQAARQLDSVAADYEDHNEYELAEKSREIATSLRTQARKLQTPSEPTIKTY